MKNDQEYITKGFFIEYMDQFRKEIIDLFTAANQYTASKVVELKNDIVQFKDEILGEIVSLREEVAVVGAQRELLEDHEERISVLEQGTSR